jgi:hypothetical protein
MSPPATGAPLALESTHASSAPEAPQVDPEPGPAITTAETTSDSSIDHLLEDELLAPRSRRPPGHLREYIRRVAVVKDTFATALAEKITFEEATQDPVIVAAMKEEIKNLFATNAIRIVPLPAGRKAISCTWAHKRKTGALGNIARVKSRLCPHGFRQIPGIDYQEDHVSAPTLHMESAMIVLAIEAQRGMASTIVDVDSAFATTPNYATTYMQFPKGMKKIPGHALLLVHSLNGTKQGAHDWHRRAHEALTNLDFRPSPIEPCLYYKWSHGNLSMVALYVDDFRIVCDKQEDLHLIETSLKARFKMKNTADNQWLGLKIDKSDDSIYISAKAKN